MLRTGYANIPHDDKASTGGEDSWFITDEVIGVADGVGGMTKLGVDSKMFSRNLCLFAEQGVMKRQVTNPLSLAKYAFSKVSVNGASTLLIVNGENANEVEVYNIGDSQLGVWRSGKGWVHISDEQEHDFNQPFQLGRLKKYMADRPDEGTSYTIETKKNDILILASDGLWDNLFPDEVSDLVATHILARRKLQGTLVDEGRLALKLATVAYEKGLDSTRESPFSERAESFGHKLPGGKPDDITVLVATIY